MPINYEMSSRQRSEASPYRQESTAHCKDYQEASYDFFNQLYFNDKKEKSLFLIFSLTARVFLGSMHFCRGAVAQLGERLNGIQEVRSSILLSSTKKEIRVCGNADPFFVFGSRRFSPPRHMTPLCHSVTFSRSPSSPVALFLLARY